MRHFAFALSSAFFFLFIPVCPLLSRPVLWGAADCQVFDALIGDVLVLGGEAGARFDDGLGIRVPLTYMRENSEGRIAALRTGLFLDYWPWGKGLFLSIGMAECYFLFGPDAPEDDSLYLNEIAIGWTWSFLPHWFLEPKVEIRDPSGVFATEAATLGDLFGDFPTFRISLLAGGSFSLPGGRKHAYAVTDGEEE